jgi:3'-phosphoadenosine 5'-phosphosulfate sulfotransferase (PAPS reductase)/FAD synthetase
VLAFSGGKDSTPVVHLVFEALSRVRPSRRQRRPIHVICSDTQVETPAMADFAAGQLAAIQRGAEHLARVRIHVTGGPVPLSEYVAAQVAERDAGKGWQRWMYVRPH